MFFSNDTTVKKSITTTTALREASQALNKEVDNCFTKELDYMQKELLDACIPIEKHEKILTQLKQDLQLEAIRKFKEILKKEEKEFHDQLKERNTP